MTDKISLIMQDEEYVNSVPVKDVLKTLFSIDELLIDYRYATILHVLKNKKEASDQLIPILTQIIKDYNLVTDKISLYHSIMNILDIIKKFNIQDKRLLMSFIKLNDIKWEEFHPNQTRPLYMLMPLLHDDQLIRHCIYTSYKIVSWSNQAYVVLFQLINYKSLFQYKYLHKFLINLCVHLFDYLEDRDHAVWHYRLNESFPEDKDLFNAHFSLLTLKRNE